MQANQKVGLWTLISPGEDGTRWKCRCDCGTVRSVLTYNLVQKKTKSCGCQRAAIKNIDMREAFQRREFIPKADAPPKSASLLFGRGHGHVLS